jgi:hypothetical protein
MKTWTPDMEQEGKIYRFLGIEGFHKTLSLALQNCKWFIAQTRQQRLVYRLKDELREFDEWKNAVGGNPTLEDFALCKIDQDESEGALEEDIDTIACDPRVTGLFPVLQTKKE